MRIIVALTCALCISTIRLAAQEPVIEFWGEGDVFVRMTETTRFFFTVSPTRERYMGMRDIQFGAHYDVGLAPWFRGVADSTLRQSFGFNYLRFRTGIMYHTGVDPDFKYQEWRGVVELTPLYPIPRVGTAMVRLRGELRFISGEFSYRFRPRIWFERLMKPFGDDGISITPYINAEIFFDSRYNFNFVRTIYQTGISFGLNNFLAVEPNLSYQLDDQPTFRSAIAPGFTVQLFF